ncbi:nicotinate-nucleotide--dimethylbenzimidazole phosphoribosyltransferase [Novosphingobium sp. EMRT-2]|uniref:nicotinate-nucleotide--dimethylbenzimidazole phosphoribosyltransferase n=1 Tax=Novosphingobium sp. EMRT-2 TaxID=2571749 RepID=UPI0010BD0AEB|nr:nicotinate-nucleotide--dimethylbenzimidazole phosphoribosyltransferase [Novosphingobium sp. EMRT-2]QCI92365.1 nicotinate-nucleotide--dimethylbenzimidazole phosphoribosyltransferase [Novosphingobium sp. EMRT-2]
MTGFSSPAAFGAALRDLARPDARAIAAARARQDNLTKPAGSLGRLEDIAVFMAGWQGTDRPVIERVRAAIFAGNHGFVVHGVSAFPASVTAAMVANFAGGGAAINALAGAANLDLRVVPLDLERPTADFTTAPAMSEDECLAALSAGAAVVEPGMHMLVVGEMGIGNSTAAAALCARSFGGLPAQWVGPGTGLDADGIARKVTVVERALALHADAPHTPVETLRRLGGREIAAIAGAVLEARRQRVPVILDGFISCAALAPLAAAVPDITDHCLAGHCSAEPGHVGLLAHLGLDPLLSLGLRLGEGSGAALAVSIIRAALATHNGMATFAEAGVAGGL